MDILSPRPPTHPYIGAENKDRPGPLRATDDDPAALAATQGPPLYVIGRPSLILPFMYLERRATVSQSEQIYQDLHVLRFSDEIRNDATKRRGRARLARAIKRKHAHMFVVQQSERRATVSLTSRYTYG